MHPTAWPQLLAVLSTAGMRSAHTATAAVAASALPPLLCRLLAAAEPLARSATAAALSALPGKPKTPLQWRR